MKTFASGVRTGLVITALSLLFVACGGKVIVDGAPASGSTEGGGGASSNPDAGNAGGGGGGTNSSCGDATCAANDGANCSCQKTCNETVSERISCVLTDTLTQKNVIQCVCTYGDVFSGVCYEKPGLACNFEKGCCAKYFSGK